MHKYRTHTCSEITKKNSGSAVKLSGWMHRKRDHGNLLFFDLRDHFGLTQCVIENSNKFFKIVEKIKPESVVCVSGEVVKRSTETVNKELVTGEVEVKVSSFDLLPVLAGSFPIYAISYLHPLIWLQQHPYY